MIAGMLRVREAGNAEVVLVTDIAGAAYAHLYYLVPSLSVTADDHFVQGGIRCNVRGGLTVDVMSDEHTSHTYLTPPSVPRDAVFFLIRPMMRA